MNLGIEPGHQPTSKPKEQTQQNQSCECENSPTIRRTNEIDLISRINFEDQLQNKVYVRG